MTGSECGTDRSEPHDLALLPATPTPDPGWILVDEGFNLAREHEVESLFAVSNGYVGSRGSVAEGSSLSAPAAFLAGVFGASPPLEVPVLVSAPDWLRLCATVDGYELTLETGRILEHRRVLDLRRGILWRVWRHQDPTGRITLIRGLRLASLADRHVLMQSVTFTPENYGGRLLLELRLQMRADEDGWPPTLSPTVEAVRPSRTASAADVTPGSPPPVVLAVRVPGTGITIAFAAATQVTVQGEGQTPTGPEAGSDLLRQRWAVDVLIGKTYRLDRLVVVYTSRDVDQPADAAVKHLRRLLVRPGVEQIVTAHVSAWETRWRTAAVEVDGDAAAQRALRFAGYHLIAAANPEDERVAVGARALTGPTYGGHVFWDCDIFMLPFYIFTHPPSARALVMYRAHTLDAARAKARALGYRGALYAWESADTGVEATPRFGWLPDGTGVEIRTGLEEHHISADVAYAVWQYWQATGDDAFFATAGAEILLETARFWASRGELEADGRYHIRRVIGPDEYHESVDDDVYTNLMAQWNLERGAEAAQRLQAHWPERWEALSRALSLRMNEAREWLRLAEAMYTGFDPKTKLYEQFAGYFDLEEIDLAAYEPRTAPMDVILGRERVQRSKVVKQADVVMAIALLWDRIPPEVREVNFRYYEARTSHGSSLSPGSHALVAARLGDRVHAARYFHQAAEIDLANNMGNAAGGVHAGALGGLWQAAILGFAGLQLRTGGLALAPHLPPLWHALRFTVVWRGQTVHVSLSGDPPRVEVSIEGDAGVPLALDDGPPAVLSPGRRYANQQSSDGWSGWQELGV
jgi:trehalose/maltose hydrolase-like predicted phosphorylase